VLDAPESTLPDGTGLYLSLLHAEELDLRAAQPVSGGIRLRNAQVGTLDDDPAVWPGTIMLNGFTYDSIRPRQGGLVPVAERLRWLDRDTVGYQPQPYEQLAAFYRRNGHEDEARRVLLVKQRRRRGTLRPPEKAFGYLLDWTVGYGYRPWLAAIWLAALLAVGTAVFTAHQPHPLQGGPVPPFNAFIYTVDLLIPIGAFGMRNAYAQTGPAQWIAYALIAAGWILATAVIAGVTRAVGRN
jgi:hypothetical protein